MFRWLCPIGFLAILAGCVQPPDEIEVAESHAPAAAPRTAVESDPPANALKILFLGNSHTGSNGLVDMVAKMLENGGTQPVYTRYIAGGFLNDIAKNPQVGEAFQKTKWNFVVLQGALLSSSHTREYPNPGIVELTKLALKNGARALYFVEWPRKGWDESEWQYGQYKRLAKEAKGGELVPICFSWDEAMKKPGLDLWSGDGNHASHLGSYLAASTLAYWMAGDDQILDWKPDSIDLASAAYLRNAARYAVRTKGKPKGESEHAS